MLRITLQYAAGRRTRDLLWLFALHLPDDAHDISGAVTLVARNGKVEKAIRWPFVRDDKGCKSNRRSAPNNPAKLVGLKRPPTVGNADTTRGADQKRANASLNAPAPRFFRRDRRLPLRPNPSLGPQIHSASWVWQNGLRRGSIPREPAVSTCVRRSAGRCDARSALDP